MENLTIRFQDKTYDFASQDDFDMANNMYEMMLAKGKVSEYIHAMLAGFAKTAAKAEKFVALEEFNALTNRLRENPQIQALVRSAVGQFARLGDTLGVGFTSKSGNKLFVDIDAQDTETITTVIQGAQDLEGVDVFVSFHDNDEPAEGESNRYARIAIEAKSGLDKIGEANLLAAAIAKDELGEDVVAKGVKAVTGDDWYPVVRPATGAGGSKGGGAKTRHVKFSWKHRQYDGLKKDVAKSLIADGMPTDQKVGDKKVTLSGEYYSKWLDQLNEAGLLADYEKYNKSAE